MLQLSPASCAAKAHAVTTARAAGVRSLLRCCGSTAAAAAPSSTIHHYSPRPWRRLLPLLQQQKRQQYHHVGYHVRNKLATFSSSSSSLTGVGNNDNSLATNPASISRGLATATSAATSGGSEDEIRTTEEPFYGRPRSSSTRSSSSSSTTTMTTTTTKTVSERISIALISATNAFVDPTRADSVAALGDITSPLTLRKIYDRMINDETGRLILKDRPVVSKSTIPYERLIAEAPSDFGFSITNETEEQQDKNVENDHSDDDDDDDNSITFGQAYGAFLNVHGFDPDERDEVRYVEDDDLAYIMLRYRQCHDYWHALTGLPPTVLGELGIKWLELFQTGLPVAALSATVGSLRLSQDERDVLLNIYLPWALRSSSLLSKKESNGNRTTPPFLMNVYYEKEFDTPLNDLRRRLGITAAPKVRLPLK
mmetsp:Transcript_18220/g.44030  ORF Transcript_18220/g.44030 Transcript_18220/m.44030 type:complete len:425 (+) Transcript_18220:107-1381(+)